MEKKKKRERTWNRNETKYKRLNKSIRKKCVARRKKADESKRDEMERL